ncbi:MAG: hypothetical protein ABR607_10510 [Pyrinomonadaceae bacterium]
MKNIDVEKNVIDPSHIKGWAVDADADNDPTYPMKLRNDGEHQGYSWERPAQQPVDVEVLHSNERPNVAATFGTSSPPSGLSGVIRRAAFNFSESSYGHWVPLMLADRIGMVEGVIDDLSRGHVPNIFREMGWNVEWKYNRKRFVTRLLVGAVVIGGTVAYLRSGKQKNGQSGAAH